MPIDIEDEAVLAVIDELAQRLGVGPEEAVGIAVGNALRKAEAANAAAEARLTAEVDALQDRVAALPVLDARPWREIASDFAGDAQLTSREGNRAA